MLVGPDSLFQEAAEAWYSYRTTDIKIPGIQYKAENTLAADRRQIESLKLFFHGTRLSDIHWYNMRSYQAARASGAEPFLRFRRPQDAKPRKFKGGVVVPPKGKTPCPAKPAQINQETTLLKRLKKLGGCWTVEDEGLFMPLQKSEPDVPRSLSPDEQYHWLQVSSQNPAWQIVFDYSMAAFDTCCSPNELRMLRLGDLKLAYDVIRVPWPAAKNKHRHREIAGLMPETHDAFRRLTARARELGAGDPVLCPSQYLFPRRLRRAKKKESANLWLYDPTRPMSDSGLKKPWDQVRAASGLTWFRIEDTRHTGATRLAERGVPADIITARMGHIRPYMRQHYTHISQHAQRGWVTGGRQASGYAPPAFGPQSVGVHSADPGMYPGVDPRQPWPQRYRSA